MEGKTRPFKQQEKAPIQKQVEETAKQKLL